MIIADASGIGRAAAARLAGHGHLVLIGSRELESTERLAAQLRARGGSAFAARLDLTDPHSINGFLAAAEYLIGTPDVLITDLGLAAPGSRAHVVRVGAQILAARVIPAMIARGRGDVVLVGPELAGARGAAARREFDAWSAALDAEFVGTQMRASTVRSAQPGAASSADAGHLLAAMITGARLCLIELLPPAVPAR